MNRPTPTDLTYERLEDGYRRFDDDEDHARGPLILALALGVLLVFGAVVWNTYRQGIRDGAGDIPIIAGPESPYKRAPDERRTESADLSRRIYDQMDGNNRGDEALEPKNVSMNTMTASGEASPRDLRPETEDIPEEPVAAAPEPVLVPEPAESVLDGGAPEEAAPAPEPVLVAEPEPAFALDPSGAFLVQIAALRTEEAAETAWSREITQYPALFEGVEKRVQRADLGPKGVFYRLRAGAFPTRAAAREFCDALENAGKACIVVQQ